MSRGSRDKMDEEARNELFAAMMLLEIAFMCGDDQSWRLSQSMAGLTEADMACRAHALIQHAVYGSETADYESACILVASIEDEANRLETMQ